MSFATSSSNRLPPFSREMATRRFTQDAMIDACVTSVVDDVTAGSGRADGPYRFSSLRFAVHALQQNQADDNQG